MKLFRICTEAKQLEQLRTLVGCYFDGFTQLRGVGMWKGQGEPTVIFEIYTLEGDRVYELARAIKILNLQETVLVQELDCRGDFV